VQNELAAPRSRPQIEFEDLTADAPVLVTGAAGFIGARVVATLLEKGCRNVRCFVRPSSNVETLHAMITQKSSSSKIDVLVGNLLSREDCFNATKDVAVIYHLAAGTGLKSFAESFLNSVVTTRNLLDAALQNGRLRRFVNLSSFSVYTNRNQQSPGLLDESCPVEDHPEQRADAYCYAKVKQDELVVKYGKEHGVPFVLIRPGVVYGPGKRSISGRVGIDTFGVFLHLGGTNLIPFTYVENCAEAIVLAGIKQGVEGETFNVVDDDLPSSRTFLRCYKKSAKQFRSIYVPKLLSYLFCLLWEKYSIWSEGQLPAAFSRKEWVASWKPTRYSNEKLKKFLGWSPKLSTAEGMKRFFESCKSGCAHA
jgi:nucleoside-diphosphate-sugar epimerase